MKGNYIVGIDEVGRGPLAGPVTLAYVACPLRLYRRNFKKIRDSKRLTPKKREEWFAHLKGHPALMSGVTSVGPLTIDRRGISKAVKIGIRRLLAHLDVKPKILLLDGSLSAPPEYPQKTIVKGDARIPIIAAASIIAKVTRDRKMVRLAKEFPNYGFEIHKGYGTRLHQKLLRTHGPCEVHRKSFCTRILRRAMGNGRVGYGG